MTAHGLWIARVPLLKEVKIPLKLDSDRILQRVSVPMMVAPFFTVNGLIVNETDTTIELVVINIDGYSDHDFRGAIFSAPWIRE